MENKLPSRKEVLWEQFFMLSLLEGSDEEVIRIGAKSVKVIRKNAVPVDNTYFPPSMNMRSTTLLEDTDGMSKY